jgi:nucleoside 2-deoxyribosyltransferase
MVSHSITHDSSGTLYTAGYITAAARPTVKIVERYQVKPMAFHKL